MEKMVTVTVLENRECHRLRKGATRQFPEALAKQLIADGLVKLKPVKGAK